MEHISAFILNLCMYILFPLPDKNKTVPPHPSPTKCYLNFVLNVDEPAIEVMVFTNGHKIADQLLYCVSGGKHSGPHSCPIIPLCNNCTCTQATHKFTMAIRCLWWQAQSTILSLLLSSLITFVLRYSLLSSRLTSLMLCVILKQPYFVVAPLCHMKLLSSQHKFCCTIQPCTSLQCHFIQSHIGRVHVYLAVTCHLHFWQNDQYLLHAIAVAQGWNRYPNMSQHRKFTLKKKILLLLLQDLNLGPFDHKSSALTTELSLLPHTTAIYLNIASHMTLS